MIDVKAKIEEINKMCLSDAGSYLKSVHRSTLQGADKNDLIVACENRIKRLDRSDAIVEPADISDYGDLSDV